MWSGKSATTFAGQGPILFTTTGNAVMAFNKATGNKLRSYGGFGDKVSCFVVSGRNIYVGSWDGLVKVFEIESGSVLHTIRAHKSMVTALAVSGDRVWSGSADKTIAITSTDAPEYPHNFELDEWVTTLDVNTENGTVYGGTKLGSVLAFDLEGTKLWARKGVHSGAVHSVVFVPEGLEGTPSGVYTASGSQSLEEGDMDPKVHVLHTLEGDTLHSFELDAGGAVAIALPPKGGSISVASSTGTITKFSTADPEKVLQTFDGGHDDAAITVLRPINGTDDLLSGADDHSVVWWEGASGSPLRTYEGHEYAISGLELLDGQVFSVGFDALLEEIEVLAWSKDEEPPKITKRYHPTANAITATCLTSTHVVLAYESKSDLTVLSRATGEVVSTLQGHTDPITTIAALGDRVYTGSLDGSVRAWDVVSAVEKRQFTGASGPITCLTFAGGNLYAGCTDGSVHAWDAYSGQVTSTFEGSHDQPVTSVLVVAGTLYSGSMDGNVVGWDIDTAEAIGKYQSSQPVHTLLPASPATAALKANPIPSSSHLSNPVSAVYNNELAIINHNVPQASWDLIMATRIPGASRSLSPSINFSAQRHAAAWAGGLLWVSDRVDLHIFSTGLIWQDRFRDHAVNISTLVTAPGNDSVVYAASTDVLAYNTAHYKSLGVKTAYMEVIPGGVGSGGRLTQRSMAEFAIAAVILLVEWSQLTAFGSAGSLSGWLGLPPLFVSSVNGVDFDFFLGAPAYLAFGLAMAMAAVFLLEAFTRSQRFLHPEATTPRRVHLGLLVTARVASRLGWLPIAVALVSLGVCNTVCLSRTGFWLIIASAFVFFPLAWRFERASEALSGVRVNSWKFWKGSNDRAAVQYRHPLSWSGTAPTWSSAHMTGKAVLALSWILLEGGVFDAPGLAGIAVPAVAHIVAVAFIAFTYLNPPYLHSRANRIRSGFDWALLAMFFWSLPQHIQADEFSLTPFWSFAQIPLVVGGFFVGYWSWSIPALFRPSGSSAPGVVGKSGVRAPAHSIAPMSAPPIPSAGPSATRAERTMTEFVGLVPTGGSRRRAGKAEDF